MPDYAVRTIFSALDRVTSAFGNMGRGARNFGTRADKAFSRASRSGAGFGNIIKGILGAQILRRGFQYLQQGFNNFVEQTKMLEDATARFQPLMGSVERSRELVDALNETAATTPFQFQGISDIASQLLPSMNGSIQDTISEFRMLGDTASGNMEKLTRISKPYSRALLTGKVGMRELQQIAGAGVPIFTEMAASMGITVEQLTEMSSKGKLTSKDLKAAFERMTSEGGIFYKGMEIASETLTGKLSTLSDNYNLTLATIGQQFLPVVKEAINLGIDATKSIREWATANKDLIKTGIDNFVAKVKMIFEKIIPPVKKIIDSILKLGNTILVIATSIIPGFIKQNASLENGISLLTGAIDIISGAIDAFATGLKFVWGFIKPIVPILQVLLGIYAAWTIAQWAINIAMTANPIGLIIAGVALLITGIGLLIVHWDAVKKGFLDGIQAIWDWFMRLLNNPFFVAIGTIFAPFLTIPGLIIKHWEPIKQFFVDFYNNTIKPIVDFTMGAAGKVGDFFGGIGDFFTGGGKEKRNAPNQAAPNAQEAEARSYQFSGQLNIAGAPPGSTVKQKQKPSPWLNLEIMGVNP